jgi:4'-phosphopantetheinyl transferase EntD
LGALKRWLPQPQCAADTALKWLRGWLPAGFGVAAAPIGERPAGAYPAEERLIARAVDRRRNEFRTGRALAREALAQIGCSPAAILARPQRDPIWPTGFFGSISHCDRLACAVAAPSSLIEGAGVDIEEHPELDPHLASVVCRGDERRQHPELAKFGIDHAKLCFVAKEAVFKAIFPQQRCALQFHQLRVCFQVPERRFSVGVRNRRGEFSRLRGMGRFLADDALMMAGFVIRRRS